MAQSEWDLFSCPAMRRKIFKALLLFSERPTTITHDLIKSLNILVEFEPSFESLRPDLAKLSAYAVALRYPGIDADLEKAEVAANICRRVRKLIRASLQLPKS